MNTWLFPRCVPSSPWCTPLAPSCDVWSPLHQNPTPRQCLDRWCCRSWSCGVVRGDEAERSSVLRAWENCGWSQTLPLRWSRTLAADVSTCCCWTLERWWKGKGEFSLRYSASVQPNMSFMKLIKELVNMKGCYGGRRQPAMLGCLQSKGLQLTFKFR